MPIARPSPRLWTPMPMATSVARARPAERRAPLVGGPAAREALGHPRERRGSWSRRPSSTSPGPPRAPGSAAWSSSASASASTARKVSRPAGQRHEGREPLRVGAAQRRAARAARARSGRCRRAGRSARSRRSCGRSAPGVSTAAGTSVPSGCPVELVIADGDTGRPRPRRTGSTIVARAQAPEGRGAVDREGDDRVVDGDHGDREVLALRVASPGPGSRRARTRPGGRRTSSGGGGLRADEARDRAARRDEERATIADEQDDRDERPAAAAPHGRRPGRSTDSRAHSSTTSKKPIQPSSANSDWWAWNMKRPVLCEVDLDDPALALAEHDRVRVLERGRCCRCGSSGRSRRGGGTS